MGPLFLAAVSLLSALSSACPHKHKGSMQDSRRNAFFLLWQIKLNWIVTANSKDKQRITITWRHGFEICHGFTMSHCLCFCAAIFLRWTDQATVWAKTLKSASIICLSFGIISYSTGSALSIRSRFLHKDGESKKRQEKERKANEKYWQKYPFPSYRTFATHTHRTHSARWPTWQAGTLCHTGGHWSVSFPTAGAVPQITTKLGTWASPPRSSASLCAP